MWRNSAAPELQFNRKEFDVAGIMEGKVVIITGAASGIGRATAQIYAREWARVIIAGKK
ncbi:MAG: hypothetical protein Dbin4_00808 [Alphaproteobacteria bacterium]|nr:hypothetical protein [Alphaproteobacteria bacterium]